MLCWKLGFKQGVIMIMIMIIDYGYGTYDFLAKNPFIIK